MFSLLKKIWNLIVSAKDAKGRLGKSWTRSKTLWVNFFAVLAYVFQSQLGFTFTGEEMSAFLVVINCALRFISGEPIGFMKLTK